MTDAGAAFCAGWVFVIADNFCEKKGKCTEGRIFIIWVNTMKMDRKMIA